MPLFQLQILKKHTDIQSEQIHAAYELYRKYFWNAEIQENIRNSKEEQFQEGFLRELFVNVLGYTLYPDVNHNLITEQKNENDQKKADGAILVNGDVRAVIELKDTKTFDLKQVEPQAFNYKAHHKNAVYVVISNFEKLRFYIENATEFFEWNLFTLTEQEFGELWICLAFRNLADDLPKRLKSDSVSREETITKEFYEKYSQFKNALFNDLIANNSAIDKLTLFSHAQKLLDRILFILFAEDCGLLPFNTAQTFIIKGWETISEEMDGDYSLYDHLKKYFSYLDKGNKNKKREIFGYNGGLFKKDEALDSLTISDDVLLEHVADLSAYDFHSDVDVNILGHIFENSLTEIEKIKHELAGLDGYELPKESKRKKDGVFYTPRYITSYIVENTLGKLCEEKKKCLNLDFNLILNQDFIKINSINQDDNKITVRDKKKNSKQNRDNLNKIMVKLDEYRNWLLSLTICDPACGSGAFLNAALDFLKAEHHLIDEMISKTEGHSLVFSDLDNEILRNNLYGVDVNEESVEITRLALWLRTAKQGRKLCSLDSNIKCGNSLIDDPQIAEEKAFNWHKEFPSVFENGGFDVVIGNPPYGAKIDKIQVAYLSEYYAHWGISSALNDAYFVFYAMALDKILKQNCFLGFITPNTWKLIDNAKTFRNLLFADFQICQIVQHLNKVFEEATVDCDTMIIRKTKLSKDIFLRFMDGSTIKKEHYLPQNLLKQQGYINTFLTQKDYDLKEKILSQSVLIKEELIIKNGVKPYEKGKGKPPQTDKTMKEKPFTSEVKKDNSFSPLIGGSYFHKYRLMWNNNYWIQYGEWLAAPREKEIFEAEEKLIFRQTSDSIIGTYVGNGFIMRDNTHIILNKENSEFHLKYILALLNSKLSDYFYWTINPEKGEAMAQVKAFHLGLLPIKKIPLSEQKPFIALADKMLSYQTLIQGKRQEFLQRLRDNFDGVKITGVLERFEEMDFKQFLLELKKQKITIGLKHQVEWSAFFNEYAAFCQEKISLCTNTDKEIDKLVYELYGLSDKEIGVVEEKP
ncbi:MAG: N-6 DNA methylase [Planctomycetaceae bacterium]|jgi:type I restriction-modification system DNA methylase subunit|nr:N-6 DNA methylase [Planctomycetaceae bacterium]